MVQSLKLYGFLKSYICKKQTNERKPRITDTKNRSVVGWGGGTRWVKRIKKYKLPVIK